MAIEVREHGSCYSRFNSIACCTRFLQSSRISGNIFSRSGSEIMNLLLKSLTTLLLSKEFPNKASTVLRYSLTNCSELSVGQMSFPTLDKWASASRHATSGSSRRSNRSCLEVACWSWSSRSTRRWRRPKALSAGNPAANSSVAELVPPERTGHRRSPVRNQATRWFARLTLSVRRILKIPRSRIIDICWKSTNWRLRSLR